MSLSIERFDEFFRALWGYSPFPWQTRLAEQVFKEDWPDCIDLPTASGKTACIEIAVFVLACQAGLETRNRTVGRRIFFAVNRRVIVDEAFDRAKSLARQLIDAKDGIRREVADVLHEISGDRQAPPLDIAQLRGGIYRDRAWARSITQPIVICTTADQLGSRLLFRGYGVSSSMQPVHAALCGCDSLVLLDEAHVTRAFCQTMRLLAKYQNVRTNNTTSIPKMRFVQMTATPAGGVKNRFGLEEADRAHPILKARQEASKPATLVKLDKKKPIAGEIVDRAFGALCESRKAIGIIVNRVQTARETERLIQKEIDRRSKKDETFKADVHLVIGRMRPIDRDDLQEKLRALVGPDRPDILDKPVFIVATQCLEVGADYDFDALITECASIDALRQRLGRLNRKGRPIEVVAAIVANEESLKGDDPIYGDAIKHMWEWLGSKKDANGAVDFGISNFKPLWQEVEENQTTYLDEDAPKRLLSPAQNAAVLLPAHLDALCQTNPQPVPSPDVSYFIHGPQRDNAEVNVCWRADLGDDPNQWPDIVRLLPPTSPECMIVPLRTVANWMRDRPTKNDADVPAQFEDDDSKEAAGRYVLIWRGDDDVAQTYNPRDLRPGDTIIIPAHADDSLILGHIPVRADGSRPLDIAELAYEQVRRQRVVRLHPSVHPNLPKDLLDYAASEESVLPKARIRELLGPLADGFTSGPDEIDYPRAKGKSSPGLLLRFSVLLPIRDQLRPSLDEDDGESSSIESIHRITLDEHAQHVADRVRQAIERIHIDGYAPLFERSADLHDIGKADVRFQALLAGLTPYEAMDRPALLAKSGQRGLTSVERNRRRIRAQLPAGFRHETLSVELIASGFITIDPTIDRDLLLHLIGAHHGHARPFAPVVIDDAADETRSIKVNGIAISPEQRQNWIPSHRLDSGIAERFWKLTREHGWWGLAWLESILRLADQQASAAEQEGKFNE
jgi:CRISPR-associated endonuclease/helicase Cas3